MESQKLYFLTFETEFTESSTTRYHAIFVPNHYFIQHGVAVPLKPLTEYYYRRKLGTRLSKRRKKKQRRLLSLKSK
jgi:hypothetical protein